ncbi:uncharacterized protein K444DRAFT_15571 [Hyaloscypha bicolor E]|uniref:Uncharacterized protein n=1 Tax=Hyaloscypha bicolor E TaxID=1095630 RepID=A0A2J6TWN8_9HELO|nr:uncharacterized protein K444DRAFT_15571 [Hyaloscypha bicolor E]PMD67427.1 hypothetical protein K444DRAFT_15571 [Hyaloscypha bicolor E]
MSQSASLHLRSVPFETTKVSVSIETDDFYFSYAETKKLSYKTTETDNFHFATTATRPTSTVVSFLPASTVAFTKSGLIRKTTLPGSSYTITSGRVTRVSTVQIVCHCNDPIYVKPDANYDRHS